MQIDSIEIVVLTALFVVQGSSSMRSICDSAKGLRRWSSLSALLGVQPGQPAFWSTVLDAGVWIGFVGPARPFFGWQLFLIGFVGPVGLAL